jgi:hypothetical protein
MDNRYYNYGCPALMQDARFITNYMDKRKFDQHIRTINNIVSAQDYKNFLQNNAEVLMNREQEYLLQLNTCDVNGACVPLSSMVNASGVQSSQVSQPSTLNEQTKNCSSCGTK